jgi:16S rRNA (cytosine967-C5)-methyltransferase
MGIPGYEEGFFFIQDAAAQHAIDRLSPQPGEAILDLCSAPGGKSFAAAMDMNGSGTILSADLHPVRLEKMKNGMKRLGLTCIQTVKNDASLPCDQWKEKFDRVICDVPCSGYGTIAKKPDIRHKDPADANLLPALQATILENGASALKKGGRLLYSTCTLNPKENEEVTDSFLQRHPEFKRIGEKETIFPIGGENDGFFCDILEKTI